MDQKHEAKNQTQVTLTDDDQAKIIQRVKRVWDHGKRQRRPYEDHWQACTKAYHQEAKSWTDAKDQWRTNLFLPWARDAVDSAYAHLQTTLMPRDENLFSIKGKTGEDHPGAETMQSYMEYALNIMDFPQKMASAVKRPLYENHLCLKHYWKTDHIIGHEYVKTPDGKMKREPKQYVDYNGFWFEIVDLDNFVMFPIHGDFNKTTKVHQSYCFLEDLEATANSNKGVYFNINKLRTEIDFKNQQELGKNTTDTTSPRRREEVEKNEEGLKVKEAWFHRIEVGGKVYHNYIATIVEDKILIRFQPNPYPYGRTPFLWFAASPDKDCLYGYGLLSGGIKLLDYGNFLMNAKADKLKLSIYGGHKYYDDSVFNPYNFVAKPGALYQLSEEGFLNDNVRPMFDNLSTFEIAYAEVAELKAEFEETTIPKVVKGLIESKDTTATEIQQAQQNSSGKLHTYAQNYNEHILKPLLESMYAAIHERTQYDQELPLEIARITQTGASDSERFAQLPEFLPLPEVDIDVVGYQNAIRRQENMVAMERVVAGALQSPWAKYLKGANILEDGFKFAELDADRYVMNDEERAQADQQEQAMQQAQMQLMAQKEQAAIQKDEATVQIDQFKAQTDAEIKDRETDIKEQELMLKLLEAGRDDKPTEQPNPRTGTDG